MIVDIGSLVGAGTKLRPHSHGREPLDHLASHVTRSIGLQDQSGMCINENPRKIWHEVFLCYPLLVRRFPPTEQLNGICCCPFRARRTRHLLRHRPVSRTAAYPSRVSAMISSVFIRTVARPRRFRNSRPGDLDRVPVPRQNPWFACCS